jgi:hypothetical protein
LYPSLLPKEGFVAIAHGDRRSHRENIRFLWIARVSNPIQGLGSFIYSKATLSPSGEFCETWDSKTP